MSDVRRSGAELVLGALLALLIAAAFAPGLGTAALFGAVLVPVALVARSTRRRELSPLALVLLAAPPVASLAGLSSLSAEGAAADGSLAPLLVLFLGFYLATLVVWSWLFWRSSPSSAPPGNPRR